MATVKLVLASVTFLAMALLALSFFAPRDQPVTVINLSGGQMILAFVGVMGVGVAIGRSWPR